MDGPDEVDLRSMTYGGDVAQHVLRQVTDAKLFGRDAGGIRLSPTL